MSNRLVVKGKKQHIRLWFEFYKLALAEPKLQKNIKKSKEFYAPWGDVTNIKFDPWWKDHKDLFGDLFVMVVKEIVDHPSTLYLAVPLNQPVMTSMSQVKELIEERQKAILKQKGLDGKKLKSTTVGIGSYELTQGVEIRGTVLHEMLVLYQYWLAFDRPPINQRFIDEVRTKLKSRPRAKWVPTFMFDEHTPDMGGVIRQMRRRLSRAFSVMEAVSLGEFPGKSTLR